MPHAPAAPIAGPMPGPAGIGHVQQLWPHPLLYPRHGFGRRRLEKRFWKGCKPNFVCPEFSRERIICLSSQYPGPIRQISPDTERAAPGSSIWPCTRWGFPCPQACAWSGGLLPHLFTLTTFVSPPAWRFVFCGTVRRDASRHHRPRVSGNRTPCGAPCQLRGIAPSGVRTFLPRLAPEAILRPSKTGGNIQPFN